MIKIENVSYKYPSRDDFALKSININIKKGEFVILSGTTGCGKTTLLKCLNGIIPNESTGEFYGNVFICGLNTRENPIRVLAQKVGMVFQNPDEQIFSTMVLDEVAFGLENLCFKEEEILERVNWALEKVGMKDFINSSTSALSGGQKQRVALASVLALKPEILVLDEPISQLDPKGAEEVLGVIKKLSDEGMTIILVEHRLHEVISWADRVIIINEGEIKLDCVAKEVNNHLELFKELGLRTPKKTDINFKFLLNKRENIEDNKLSLEYENREKAVEIKDVFFSYEKKKRRRNPSKWILKGVNLNIYKGEILGVLGNNGSGKSTLMHHIAGLNKPHEGSVIVYGKDTKKNSAFKLAGTVGILFQNPELMLSCDSVYEEIAFGPQNLKYSNEKIHKIVKENLDSLELNELSCYHPQTISGGQRLRCAAASILSMTPKVILLDEPTSGQDILHIKKLMQLCEILKDKGNTIIFITHDYEVALKYSDRIVYVDDGNILINMETKYILSDEEKEELL